MKLLDAVKARIGGHTPEKAAEGGRSPLTKTMAQAVREHLPDLGRADLSHYTFEYRHTMYPGARFDLVIYDEYGGQVIRGRETDDGRVIVWR